jgi:polar amino acid transport system substrate-binding protein
MSAPARTRGALALAAALTVAAALGGCASVSEHAQDRSLAALKTQAPTPRPGLLPLDFGGVLAPVQQVLDPAKGCDPDHPDRYRRLELSALPAPGRMPAGTFMREIQRRRLIVGVDQSSLGLGYFNPETKRMEGFDIDVVRQIARAIFGGRGDPDDHILVKAISTPQREAAIVDGDVDIVASAFSITCQRQRRLRFSSVYHRARQRLLVHADSDVDELADLDGKKVCVTSTSTTAKTLEGTRVLRYPVELRSDCLVALQERDVDAVTADDTILLGNCRQDPLTKIVGPTINTERYGLAMDLRRTGFARFVNAVLERIDLEALRKRWFKGLSATSDAEIRDCGPAA